VEFGNGTPGGEAAKYFSGTTPRRNPATPFNLRTVCQFRGGPTTARLRRVSTSLMAAGEKGDVVDENYFGTPAAPAAQGGHDASSAPPKSTVQM
jgi:hypothetical protein